jgi:mannose-1-phosphate guanylyltransferase
MMRPPWSVVLAGGDGLRVSALTRGRDGTPAPKQYCRLGGRPPMVRWAIERACRILPKRRVLVVVNEGHRRFWEKDLADIPRPNLLVQPANRGTAAGVLLGLLAVEARASDSAPIVFLPSDHYVSDEDVLRDSMARAVSAIERDSAGIFLLGTNPTDRDQEYGWILPDADGDLARVQQFVEKPAAAAARDLARIGALVNTFVIVARVQAMIRLFERLLPDLLSAFRAHAGRVAGAWNLDAVYESIPPHDLSREVLQRSPECLSVVRVPACGWSDLGTPARLLNFLGHPATAA